MIHAVVLVKADTGEYLLDRKYGKIDVDGALLSGMISALKSFIGEVIEGEIIKAEKTRRNKIKRISYSFRMIIRCIPCSNSRLQR